MKKFLAAIFALAALAATGCAHLGHVYLVTFSPDFTPAEGEAIAAAVADWQANLPEARIRAVMAPCTDLPDVICVHRSTATDIVTHHGATVDALAITYGELEWGSADVWLAVDAIPAKWFQGVVAHELGHAMGLHHEDGCLMAASPDDGWSMVVTPKDVAQWRSYR